jgi:hypothetical protein
MDFLGSWYFIGGMLVVLIALIGLYMFLRNQKED